MRFASCGKRSDISTPDWPHFLKTRREPSKVPKLRALSTGSFSLNGIGWPCRLTSSGLGSNKSTWLGPPYMNKKITFRAFAGKCGGLGASGEGGAAAVFSDAPARPLKKPSCASIAVKAVPTNPPPACQRNPRRVRPHGGPPRRSRRHTAARGTPPGGRKKCNHPPPEVNGQIPAQRVSF